MEKEAKTVSKSLQSLPLSACPGKERREPRICMGISLKAQTKKKKGSFTSSDHGCSTSHLHLPWLCCPRPDSSRPWEGRARRGFRGGSKPPEQQPVRSRGELCQKLDIGVYCLGSTSCLPDRFTQFEFSKPKPEVIH